MLRLASNVLILDAGGEKKHQASPNSDYTRKAEKMKIEKLRATTNLPR